MINGGRPLCGQVEIPCSKNAYLPILAGCILCDGKIVLHKCPRFSDIDAMLRVLETLGTVVVKQNDDLYIDCTKIKFSYIPSELTKIIRSSIFTLGALLGRLRRAKIAYPGGCDIGVRPIDLHLKGLRALGIKVEERHGYISCESTKFCAGSVDLDYPSVGATENLMMVAVLSSGVTTIRNPAREPEIVDLQDFLNSMGAKISGAGTNEIVIQGVDKLHSTEYTPMRDRIVAGTLLVACAMTGGEVTLTHCNPEHFLPIVNKLVKSSCKIEANNDNICISSDGCLQSFGELETGPYPAFPTDMQTQMLTMSTICKGSTLVTENVFESRFRVVPELSKMGADIVVQGRTAFVRGVDRLLGATVYAHDLRGGAGLVLAGLCAVGYTTVYDVWHIDRGYEQLDQTLASLGADIHRLD